MRYNAPMRFRPRSVTALLPAVLLPATLLLAACASSSPQEPPPSTAASSAESPAAAAAPTGASVAPPAAPEVVERVDVPAYLREAVDATDRTEADRKLDAGRHPAETLAFFGINHGMKVAELGAGGGYTAELLARAVGPTGVVYGQNAKFILERFAEKPWSERLARPVMKTVVRVDREFNDPLPPEAKDLDAVILILFYHDTYWMDVDRSAMNRAVFKALKPGGVYGIIDHSGRAGTGSTEVKTLHRIEEKLVRDEITSAGFRLAAEASFLRVPADTRDWNASPTAAGDKRGQSDRFVLKFVKP